jgi:hypothetical protein
MSRPAPLLAVLLALAFPGCATGPYREPPAAYADRPVPGAVLRALALDAALEDRILALDPDRISESDLRSTLAAAPAPRIILVHGGVYPVHLAMESFAEFLIGMGYPERQLRDPGDGRWSYSPYAPSQPLAGRVAWHYEREGVRPMLVGHSGGGVQVVKVLYDLGGRSGSRIAVWNPLRDRAEDRFAIVDPLTGQERPVVGLSVSYASAVGAGGAGVVLFPTHWPMLGKVRAIPDTVDEFVGHAIDLDLIAWDLGGVSPGFAANGKAKVRNVRLPAGYAHVVVPVTAHLAKDLPMRDRINGYTPEHANGLGSVPDGAAADNALWAADMWYSIKRHWCLEAQRLIRAKRAALGPGSAPGTAANQGREDVGPIAR